MILIVRIEGAPVRQFYADARALGYLEPKEARHALLRAVPPLKAEADGAVPNLTITLNNSGGELTRLFADPPLAAPLELIGVEGDVATTLFAGIVSKIDISATEARVETTA